MKKVIDARGLDCPKPVLEIKKILEKGDFNKLVAIVDNKAARENISRFLNLMGHEVTKIEEIKGDFYLYVEVKKNGSVSQETSASKISGKTLFIASDSIGHGSDELGKKLMKAFTFTLTELDTLPKRLLFMNSGVYICLNDSDSLSNLKKLIEMGVEIYVCGTCLDFLGVSDQLAVGKVSNMYDLAGFLLRDNNVVKI